MKIAYGRSDGGVDIVIPASMNDLKKVLGDDLTEEAYLQFVWDRSVPVNAINPRWITDDEIPEDTSFRDAWKHEENVISVNMDKAREIHMGRIRAVRNEKLAELDVQTMKGIDVQDKKQVLRDLPKTVDLTTAFTTDELKAIWPQELLK